MRGGEVRNVGQPQRRGIIREKVKTDCNMAFTGTDSSEAEKTVTQVGSKMSTEKYEVSSIHYVLQLISMDLPIGCTN